MCTTYKRNVASGICSIFVHRQPIIDPMVLPRCMPPEAEAEADSSPIDGSLSFNFRPYRSDLHLLASYRCVAARPASIPIRSCTCRCTYIYYYVTCHSDVRIIFFSIYQLDRTAFIFFKFDLDNLKIKFQKDGSLILYSFELKTYNDQVGLFRTNLSICLAYCH